MAYLIRDKRGNYSEVDKHLVVRDFLKSGKSKCEIWRKYTGEADDHGKILKWMRKLGYSEPVLKQKASFSESYELRIMASEKDSAPAEGTKGQAKDVEQLLQEISKLKAENRKVSQELRIARYQATLSDTMIELAEKELNIVIRKNLPAKP